MKDSELLVLAKAEITSPGNWTKDNFARDESGKPIDVLDNRACQFCSMGAVHKALQRRVDDGIIERGRFATTSRLFRLLEKSIGVYENDIGTGVAAFNDSEDTQHDDVIAVFDLAIKAAKQKEEDDQSVPSVS